MKQIRTWKIGPNPPDVQSGWIYKGVAKYFNNGKWEILGGNIPNPDVPGNMIEVSITDTQLANLLNGQTVIVTSEDISPIYNTVVVKLSNYGYYLHKNMGSNDSARYSTGNMLTGTSSSEITILEGIVSNGVVTLKTNHISLSGGSSVVALQIGDSEEIKKHNLSALIPEFFQVQLDYGYGVGNWAPTTGGFAHVTTAYGQDVFYIINKDGSVIKDEDYIKPNHPYTLELQASQIGTPVDDVTASGLLKCGEIIINGSTGPITYTRSVDSTSSAIFFTSSKKDDTLQVLTYNVSTKTITASIAAPASPVAERVELLSSDPTTPLIVSTVNEIITKLQAAGLMKS